MVSFSIILIVALFIEYMAIDFWLNDGLTLRVLRDLFVMIVAVFILIIAIYKNDAFNLKSSKKILNLSLIYVLNYLKILL